LAVLGTTHPISTMATGLQTPRRVGKSAVISLAVPGTGSASAALAHLDISKLIAHLCGLGIVLGLCETVVLSRDRLKGDVESQKWLLASGFRNDCVQIRQCLTVGQHWLKNTPYISVDISRHTGARLFSLPVTQLQTRRRRHYCPIRPTVIQSLIFCPDPFHPSTFDDTDFCPVLLFASLRLTKSNE
jgi:hypothetical protein